VILNALLLHISGPPIADGNGGYAPAVQTVFSRAGRCTIDQPNFVQQKQLEGNLKDVTGVLYVAMPLEEAGVAVVPAAGGDCTVQQDGQAAVKYRIARVTPRTPRTPRHYEIFVQAR